MHRQPTRPWATFLAAAKRGGPGHFLKRTLSRRHFLWTAAGAGAVLGSRLCLPGRVSAADDNVLPNPIPGVLAPGSPFHEVGLGPADQGHEPSVITDFEGFIGVAGGGGTGKDSKGNALTLSFDFRFMSGVYVGVDGQKHQGAFAFIWLDVFTSSGSSIHSYDPGIKPFPNGLFWLTAPGVISQDNIVTHLAEGKATLEFKGVPVFDWTTLANSLSNGTLLGPATNATMSATVGWSGVTRRVNGVRDATNGYGGDFLENVATLTASTKNADGSTFSGTGNTSTTGIFGSFAEIGQEHNGVFFKNGG